MTSRARLAVLAVLFLLAAVALQLPDATTGPPRPPTARVSPPPTATASQRPEPSITELNRQDQTSLAQRRRETRAFDDRPLLAVLPIELAGVRIEVAGLAADDRTTILEIAAGRRGRSYARALYRRALAAYGDHGTAYAIRWATR